MNPNLAQILASAAIVILDGVTIRPKAGVTFKPIRPTFDITSGTIGRTATRVNETGAEISFVPDGQFTTGIAGVLHPYKSLEIGEPLAARLTVACSAINTTTDVITSVAHGYTTTQAVKISYTSVAPTVTGGFPRNTTLYVRAIDADTFTLHTSAADATNNVNKVDFTAQGTGSIILARMRTCVIHCKNGVKVTFHNVAVSQLPNLRISGGETLFQAVTIRCFHSQGAAVSSSTLYTITQFAFTDAAFDDADYLTNTPSSVSWGASAPFDDMPVGSSVEVDFTLNTSELLADASRVSGLLFQSIGATAKLRVPGLTWAETLSALGFADAATRGSSVTEAAFAVVAGALNFGMRAVLDPADFQAAAEQDMVGQLTFSLVRGNTDGIGDAWYELYLD